MGYPVFWTALLVPLALWLGKKKYGTSDPDRLSLPGP